jgi:hypothetical protein
MTERAQLSGSADCSSADRSPAAATACVHKDLRGGLSSSHSLFSLAHTYINCLVAVAALLCIGRNKLIAKWAIYTGGLKLSPPPPQLEDQS